MALRDKLECPIDLKYYLDALEDAKSSPLRTEKSLFGRKLTVPWKANTVAACYYLLEDKANAAKFARETVDTVVEYYYGTWRETALTDVGTRDSNWWRIHTYWMDHFRQGLCWALAIGDWTSAQKIADYPTDECKVDSGFTKEDKASFLAVANLVRREPATDCQTYLHEIRNGKKEKSKQIAAVVEALQAKDVPNFQKSLEAYLDHFRKREFKRNALDNLLCYDGTILIDIGKREGLEFDTPSAFEDYIIRLSS
jgi:predicted cupin superfamily sugar epimerase